LALVLALGGLGVGFAMWSETLTIDGTVNTGTFDVTFTAASWDDTGEEKDIGSGGVTGVPGDELVFTLTNVYPCYGGDLDFTISNSSSPLGTIPGHVDSVWFHAKGPGKYGTEIDVHGNFVGSTIAFIACNRVELPVCSWLYFDLDNDCDADVSLHLKDGFICSQIDPPGIGENGSATGTINVHIEQGADEDDTYYFNIEVDVVQWNEAG